MYETHIYITTAMKIYGLFVLGVHHWTLFYNLVHCNLLTKGRWIRIASLAEFMYITLDLILF